MNSSFYEIEPAIFSLTLYCSVVTLCASRAMVQAVSRRPLAAEARVRSRISPCGICSGQSGTETDFSPSTSVFTCQFNSTGDPLLGKAKE
jgi:hypothetical protein